MIEDWWLFWYVVVEAYAYGHATDISPQEAMKKLYPHYLRGCQEVFNPYIFN